MDSRNYASHGMGWGNVSDGENVTDSRRDLYNVSQRGVTDVVSRALIS
jgi:hypothetical protein